jgi:hypothetical protein
MSEAQLITMIRNGEFSAVSLYLRTHHQKYGNKLEITGNIKTEPKISPEQQEAISEALGQLPRKKRKGRVKNNDQKA